MESFFEEEALDYELHTIIRREILPSGKSRAFVNDTPVTLQSLSKLGLKLIDIHSQHQTLEITSDHFQFEIIDALADTKLEIESYQRGLQVLKESEQALKELVLLKEKNDKETDYQTFLLNELKEAALQPGEQAEVEEKYQRLNNIEEIQEHLSTAAQSISADQMGISDQLNIVRAKLSKLSSFSKSYEELYERTESVYIELQDIQTAIEDGLAQLETNPNELEQLSARLQLFHQLQSKHQVASVEALLDLQETLEQKVDDTASLLIKIEKLKDKILTTKNKLNQVAAKIHRKREKIIPELVTQLEAILKSLGMPNASFEISLEWMDSKYFKNGKDALYFLFSANKGSQAGQLKKVASGGELSRIMLAVKVILSRYTQLPTLIFDEIDTGVSGEVAQKMADLMKEMSTNLQIFTITHLPQVAANGHTQYKVFKEDINEHTITQLKLLSDEERVKEIAEMIGGKDISDTALVHAKSLLFNKTAI